MKSETTTIDYEFTFNINKLIEQILSFNYIVHLFSGPPDSGLSCHGSDNPSHLACQVLMMLEVVLNFTDSFLNYSVLILYDSLLPATLLDPYEP